jgi:predicted MPP superfamily phosphohydrolase
MRHVLALGLGAGAAAFLYGVLFEADRLVVERRTLRLPRWPRRLSGFRIAVLADLHLFGPYSAARAEAAVAAALDASPDMVVIPGDVVSVWDAHVPALVGETLEPLLLMQGNVVAVPGNHEYFGGSPELLRPILDELNIKLLRNEAWRHAGVTWVGVDSANEGFADPVRAMRGVDVLEPAVALWHEPDLVDWLPQGASLMISGHSHGGQFLAPWGWAPKKSKNGRAYVRGFFPRAATPLYVSRGVGMTGWPSRLFCRPEVSVLTLESAEGLAV